MARQQQWRPFCCSLLGSWQIIGCEEESDGGAWWSCCGCDSSSCVAIAALPTRSTRKRDYGSWTDLEANGDGDGDGDGEWKKAGALPLLFASRRDHLAQRWQHTGSTKTKLKSEMAQSRKREILRHVYYVSVSFGRLYLYAGRIRICIRIYAPRSRRSNTCVGAYIRNIREAGDGELIDAHVLDPSQHMHIHV
jgi:hypothetical protein